MAINNPNQQQKQMGSGFTNLQSIMRANQGNKLGQAVSSGIQQTGQQVQQGLQKGQQDFQDQAQQGQLGTQQQKENVENVLKDPTQASDQDISNFAKYRAGQYSGPQGISNIDTLKGQAQQAQQEGQAIGSEGGRQSLLQKYAASPGQYQAGQQRLDTLLLGATPGNQLQTARRSVSGLNNQVTGAQSAAQQQAQQYTQQAQGFGNQVAQQTGQAQANVYNPAQATAQAANITEQQNADTAQTAKQNAGQNKLSQEAMDALGLHQGENTYGANLGQFVNYNTQNEQANALNVMSQPDFQKYSKLQQLMGQTPSAQPQNPYQAGQISYDKDAAQAAIASRHAEVAPKEQQLATARKIMDIWNQTGDYAGQNRSVGDRQAEIATIAPGSLGGSAEQNYAWAQSNLASRLKDVLDTNANYGQTVSRI